MRGIIEPGSLRSRGFFPTEKLFVGHFDGDRFKVERLDQLQNGSFPIIEGKVEATATGARWLVTMRPKLRDAAGGLVWFAIGGTLLLVSLLGPLLNPHIHGSPSFTMFTILLLAAAYAMVAAGFNLEIRKTQTLLNEAMQSTPSERIREAIDETPARRMKLYYKSAQTFGVAMAIIFIGAIVFPAIFAHTEQFRIAQDYIRADPRIRNEIGTVTSAEADRTHGYHSTSTIGGDDSCDFAVRVTGARGRGVVTITMRKHLGKWEIASAQLRESDGRMVALDTAD